MCISREALWYLYPASECSQTRSIYYATQVSPPDFRWSMWSANTSDPENILSPNSERYVRAVFSLMVSCHPSKRLHLPFCWNRLSAVGHPTRQWISLKLETGKLSIRWGTSRTFIMVCIIYKTTCPSRSNQQFFSMVTQSFLNVFWIGLYQHYPFGRERTYSLFGVVPLCICFSSR